VSPTAVEGLDLPALERFLADHVPGFSGGLDATLLAGGRSNLTYLLTDGTARWVLRRPPLGGLTPSAHDVLREYRVTAALSTTDVPVPRYVAYDEGDALGVPFAVVDYVPGAHACRTPTTPTAYARNLPCEAVWSKPDPGIVR
jgi:aminoglycoside phosphotransferase (APT) family kinase protein